MTALDDGGGLKAIDWLLGEGSPDERARLEAQASADPALTLELAETVELLERLRSLRIEPGPRLGFGLARLDRTARLRLQRRRAGGIAPLGWATLLAAAALTFAALWLWHPFAPRPAAPWRGDSVRAGLDLVRPAQQLQLAAVERELQEGSAELPVPDPPFAPDTEPRLYAALARLAERSAPDPLSGWLLPSNAWMVQRLEAELRGSEKLRRRALARSGGNPDADGRVQQLAVLVAGEVQARIAAGAAEPREVAQALRALVAAGSTRRSGPCAATVGECATWLLAAVHADLRGADLAAALFALVEPAIATTEIRTTVRDKGRQLVEEILDARGRPALLSWRTPVGCLADAGRLMAILPAYGVDPEQAFRARRLSVAHLEERRMERDGPEILLAELYGYADLVDRAELDLRVQSWRPAALLPDYEALQHLAWSREPGAPGWTRFQRELRRMAAVPTPDGLTDRASLLMCLATDFAAPGVASLLTLTE